MTCGRATVDCHRVVPGHNGHQAMLFTQNLVAHTRDALARQRASVGSTDDLAAVVDRIPEDYEWPSHKQFRPAPAQFD